MFEGQREATNCTMVKDSENVLLRLIGRATGEEEDDEDTAGDSSSDSESEDGNTIDEETSPRVRKLEPEPKRPRRPSSNILPLTVPPAIDLRPCSPSGEVQQKFRAQNQDLTWKMNYLDLKIEAGVLNDYKEYADECRQSAVRGEFDWRRPQPPINFPSPYSGESSRMASQRLQGAILERPLCRAGNQ